MKRILTIFLSLLILCSFNVSTSVPELAYGKTISELQEEKKELEAEKDAAQAALDSAKSNQDEVLAELQNLDSQFAVAQNELEIIEAQLVEAEIRLVTSEAELEQAIIKKDDQFELFSKRLKYIHEHGTVGYLEVVLESNSVADFLARMQYVNDIIAYDQKTLERLALYQEIIEEETEAIENETNAIAIMVEDQEVKNASLEQTIDQKNALFAQYQNEEEKYAAILEETIDASNEVQALINAATRTSSATTGVYYTGNGFAWPVPGWTRVSSGYGYRSSVFGSGSEFHTGIDIPAAYATDIIATEGGRVITSSYINGYGYTVIIDHGGGITSLYGHNSSLNVRVGDTVSKGEVIAFAGSTGYSTGNHLHFEIRENGKHVNPYNYL